LKKISKVTIFLDTSIVERDFRLRSGDLLHLLRICGVIGGEVVLPSVVLSDLIAHYESEITSSYKELMKLVSGLERYTYYGAAPNIDINIRESIEGYENWLNNRLKQLGIDIGGYPKTKHKDVVRRAAAGRKPFKNHDRGYKDTLIWESVLEYLRLKSRRVLLLSADKDFGENSILHQDLLDDIRENGMNDGAVKLFQEYDHLIEYLDREYDVSQQLQEEEKALWAGVSKQVLNETVPFRKIIEGQRNQIERIIIGNASKFIHTPSDFDKVLSLSKVIVLDNPEFNASYTGNGIWKLDVMTIADTELEITFIISDNLQSQRMSEELRIEIQSTIYFDCKTKDTNDILIRNVKKIA